MKPHLLFLFFILNIIVIPTAQAQHRLDQKFEIICETPCPVDESYKKEFKKFVMASYRKLLRLTKTNLPVEFLPIKIHLTKDAVCDSPTPNAAYVLPSGPNKGTICMLYIPKLERKYSADFAAMAHELSHFYFPPSKDMAMIDLFEHPLIYTVKSFIDAPKIYSTFCHGNFGHKESKKEIIFHLCRRAGFDIGHVPQLLAEIRLWKNNHPGEFVTLDDYAAMLKKVLKRDVSRVLAIKPR